MRFSGILGIVAVVHEGWGKESHAVRVVAEVTCSDARGGIVSGKIEDLLTTDWTSYIARASTISKNDCFLL